MFSWHLTSLLLHLANSALVFLLISRLFSNRLAALIASMLFAIHGTRPEAAKPLPDEIRCENKPMRHRLHLRLKALEKWLPDESKAAQSSPARMADGGSPSTRDPVRCFRFAGKEFPSGDGVTADRAGNACAKPGLTAGLLWLEASQEDCNVLK